MIKKGANNNKDKKKATVKNKKNVVKESSEEEEEEEEASEDEDDEDTEEEEEEEEEVTSEDENEVEKRVGVKKGKKDKNSRVRTSERTKNQNLNKNKNNAVTAVTKEIKKKKRKKKEDEIFLEGVEIPVEDLTRRIGCDEDLTKTMVQYTIACRDQSAESVNLKGSMNNDDKEVLCEKMLKNKNFVKQYLQVPYFTDLMKLITRCRTFAEFEYEVNQELPQLVEESDGVVLEFYKEKNKEDVPIVSLMNCKILCKAVLSVDKYLFRAKKSIKEKLDRHFKSIISEMFDKATILKANAKLLEYESEDNDSEKTNTEKKKKKKRKKKDSDDEEDFVSDDENEGQKKKIAKKVEKNKKKLSKKTNSDEVFFDRLFFEELFEPDEIIYEKLNLLANKKGPEFNEQYFKLCSAEKYVRVIICKCPVEELVINEFFPPPVHISCIIGLRGVYEQILFYAKLEVKKFDKLRTLSFLKPNDLTVEKFSDFVLNDRLKHLKWEKSSIIKTQYGNNSDEDKQERIIVVFKRKIKTKNQMMNNDSPDFREERQNKSFEYYRNQFGSIDLINIGTTEMGKSACKNLIKELDITRKDVCWEIGCGRPKLAFCMSATATNTVVATEISEVFANLKLVRDILALNVPDFWGTYDEICTAQTKQSWNKKFLEAELSYGGPRRADKKPQTEVDSDLEEEEEKATRIENYRSLKNYLEKGDWISYQDPMFPAVTKKAQITAISHDPTMPLTLSYTADCIRDTPMYPINKLVPKDGGYHMEDELTEDSFIYKGEQIGDFKLIRCKRNEINNYNIDNNNINNSNSDNDNDDLNKNKKNRNKNNNNNDKNNSNRKKQKKTHSTIESDDEDLNKSLVLLSKIIPSSGSNNKTNTNCENDNDDLNNNKTNTNSDNDNDDLNKNKKNRNKNNHNNDKNNSNRKKQKKTHSIIESDDEDLNKVFGLQKKIIPSSGSNNKTNTNCENDNDDLNKTNTNSDNDNDDLNNNETNTNSDNDNDNDDLNNNKTNTNSDNDNYDLNNNKTNINDKETNTNDVNDRKIEITEDVHNILRNFDAVYDILENRGLEQNSNRKKQKNKHTRIESDDEDLNDNDNNDLNNNKTNTNRENDNDKNENHNSENNGTEDKNKNNSNVEDKVE